MAHHSVALLKFAGDSWHLALFITRAAEEHELSLQEEAGIIG